MIEIDERPKAEDVAPTWEVNWFGTPAHFIGSAWCGFHLATVAGDWIVSTVGELVWPNKIRMREDDFHRSNWDTMGIDPGMFYETMVFRAGKPCEEESCGRCGVPALEGDEKEQIRYATAGEATRGHYAMIEKWLMRRAADYPDYDWSSDLGFDEQKPK